MCFRKKKVEVQPKKEISLTEMKIKVNGVINKINQYVAKLQANSNKYVEKAAEAKMKGRDASLYIKRVAALNQKVLRAEKLKVLMETRVEDYEGLMLDTEFLSSMKEVSETLGEFNAVDVGTFDNLSKIFESANIKIAEQQDKVAKLVDSMDSAMNCGIEDDYAFDEVSKRIDAILDQEIKDSQLDATPSSSAIAKKVADKINY